VDPGRIGLVGGIAGGLIGLMGAAIGTYFSVRNTNGPRERAFVIRSAVGLWVAILALAIGSWFATPTVRSLVAALFFLAIAPAIRLLNRRQQRIRGEEEAEGLVSEPGGSGSGPR